MNSILVSFCVSFSLIIFLIAAGAGLCSITKSKKVRQYPSFTDLLIYSHLCDSKTVALKSGALMRVYSLSAPSMRYASEHTVVMQQQMLSKALHKLGGNFSVNVDFIRQRAVNANESVKTDNEIANEFLSLREDCVTSGATYKVSCYLSLTYRPSILNSKVKFKNPFTPNNQKEQEDKDYLIQFDRAAEDIKNSLGNALILKECSFYKKDGLVYHEAVDYLFSCIHGGERNIRIPNVPFFLDAVLSPYDFYTGTVPHIGNKAVCSVAIEGMPGYSYFDILGRLSQLPFTYRFYSRFISYDSVTSNINLERYRRLWAQKKRGLITSFFSNSQSDDSNANKYALDQLNDLSEAKRSLDHNELCFGAYSAGIILIGEDYKALYAQANECLKQIEASGFSGRIESINATDSYLGSLPGECKCNLRRSLISDKILCDLLPFESTYTGEKNSPNPLYGKNAPPLMKVRSPDGLLSYLNLHSSDLANCLVVGPPGTGKSVFLGSLLTSFLQYPGMTTFVFDRGYSFYAAGRALGAAHITLDNEGEVRFCPLYDLSDEEAKREAVEFVSEMFKNRGVALTPEYTDSISRSISLLAGMDSESHNLSTLYTLLPNHLLKSFLFPYLGNGEGRSIIDGTGDPVLTSNITIFECADFIEKNDLFLYPTLHSILKMIERKLKNAKAGLIIIDEAWQMLCNRQFSEIFVSWIKTLRKHNVAVVIATQSISDLIKSERISDFLDCIKTRVFLPNSDATGPVLKEFYKSLSLEDEAIKAIAEGRAKKDLFIHKDGYFMPFNLALSDAELKLLSLSKKDRQMVDEKYSLFGQDFVWNL